MVGRNGVFYDRTGADWDADHRRSSGTDLPQAFWSPATNASVGHDLATDQKFAGAQDKAVEGQRGEGRQ